ncbi:anhydro-N-acetylmuramic acid kinase [Donghicola sp. C2-DW-16]|uniref:Anhydro-N-acetylmuramic acid kinase n=1 Tax=Donghicola mangrovi TaxID=2729614 RepID=A0ABX2PE83_9RHOB|nr:anhydro-N-acetylmuramic acid kinase [Donghicola mangrovi]NVO27788.1 anhydro-N-acetylmuramic acid kinase [Donghicola mangrovi]
MKQSGALRALGTMSGTSLDGVDAAVVVSDGHRILEFGESAYQEYTPAQREILRAAFGRWQDQDVADAAEVVETVHAQVMAPFKGIDLGGFHGQTLAHDPRGRGTHQCGDGAILAELLGYPVVWDFRSADVKLGGEGAPLAPFFHFACAKYIEAAGPVAFLNLGGVGNLTYVDPRFDRPEEDGALLAFDTGPANAPVNDLMLARRGLAYDEDGALAASGTPDEALIAEVLERGFFYRIPPKSLDRDDFADVMPRVQDMSDADAAATLTLLAVRSVVAGLQYCPEAPERLLVTGGGRKNAFIMNSLRDEAHVAVEPVEEAGLDGDMLEAQAFAHLAVRVAKGLPTSCRSTTGVAAAVGGGTISRPTVSALFPE